MADELAVASTVSSSSRMARATPHFAPAVDRTTSILIVRLKRSDQFCLITTLSTRTDTQLIRIDPMGGRLHHEKRKGFDVFDSEAEALDLLAAYEQYEIVERASALLGYAPIGNIGMLLLAMRVRSAAVLPGGHVVRLVAESKWLRLPLKEFGNIGKELAPEEEDRVDAMLKFTLNNAHYYCETADLSRPFPSTHPVGQPSWEFVWNRFLSASFRATGLAGHCPQLLQGVVEARTLEDARGRKYTLMLVSRRSRLHPGMRYIARGLNGLASPGNEIECEQVVWTVPSEPGGKLDWSCYAWRRGTVPIWWGVEIKSGGVGDADIYISADNPYRGTTRYFRRLQRRYLPDQRIAEGIRESSDPSARLVDADAADVNGSGADTPGAAGSSDDGREGGGASPSGRGTPADPSLQVPVTCVNLLRCNMQRKAELLLSEHFAEGVRVVRKSRPGIPLQMINFDWHGNMTQLKEKGTVEGLWMRLSRVMNQSGFSAGSFEPGAEPDVADKCTSGWDDRWHMRWRRQQQGVLRYNCADSLDRTNAASYFGAVQVLVEQCRQLGIQVEVEGAPADLAASAAAGGRRKPRELGVGGLEISSIHRRVKDMMRARASSPTSAQPMAAAAATAAAAGGGGGAQMVQIGEPPLPVGWEARRDEVTGRTFYIDHNTKATTWVRPAPPAQLIPGADLDSGDTPGSGGASPAPERATGGEANSESDGGEMDSPKMPASLASKLAAAVATGGGTPEAAGFGLFGLGVDEVRAKLRADLVAEHAEVFLINGDMNSNLYTSSRAMHSAILSLLQGEAGAMSKAGIGKLQNLSVSVQRRWNNVLSDTARQAVMEMFLGLRLQHHFPGCAGRLLYADTLPLEPESDDEGEPDMMDLKKVGGDPELVNQTTIRQEMDPPLIKASIPAPPPAAAPTEPSTDPAPASEGPPQDSAGPTPAFADRGALPIAKAASGKAGFGNFDGDLLHLDDDAPAPLMGAGAASKPHPLHTDDLLS